MIELVVDSSCAGLPTMARVIDYFSGQKQLTWLVRNGARLPSAPANVPIAKNLREMPDSRRLVLLLAPPDVATEELTETRKEIRVIERHSPQLKADPSTLAVDDFSRLELLSALSDYPGMSRLLARRDWTAKDFRAAILARHEAAIDALLTGKRAAIFGAQRLGEQVGDRLQASGIQVHTYLDNSTKKHGTKINGIEVIPLSSLTDKTLPVVIATTRFTSSITRQLESEGFHNILPYSVMSLLDPDNHPDEIPYIGIQQDFAEHLANYLGLFLSLSDDKSRRVLDGLIGYRLDYDSRLAEAIADDYSRQYFDAELIHFGSEDVFVDLGAYDGDTTAKYIEFSTGDYATIYVFEPDENLFRRASERLAGHRSIEFIPAGAYSIDGELRFATTGRTNGAISDTGNLVIPVRKLDSVIQRTPTMIKMDIEGAETDALRGAANLLRTARPKLAIAAYHLAPDLWRLADVVREINPAYRFYLRHYSETGLESVLYAI